MRTQIQWKELFFKGKLFKGAQLHNQTLDFNLNPTYERSKYYTSINQMLNVLIKKYPQLQNKFQIPVIAKIKPCVVLKVDHDFKNATQALEELRSFAIRLPRGRIKHNIMPENETIIKKQEEDASIVPVDMELYPAPTLPPYPDENPDSLPIQTSELFINIYGTVFDDFNKIDDLFGAGFGAQATSDSDLSFIDGNVRKSTPLIFSSPKSKRPNSTLQNTQDIKVKCAKSSF